MHLVTTDANDALSRIRQSPEMWSTVPTKMIIFCSRLVCTHRAGPPLRVWLCVSVVSGIGAMQLFSIRQKVEVFISALFIRIITDGDCQVENYDKVSKVSRDTKKTFVLHYNYLVAVVHQNNATLH